MYSGLKLIFTPSHSYRLSHFSPKTLYRHKRLQQMMESELSMHRKSLAGFWIGCLECHCFAITASLPLHRLHRLPPHRWLSRPNFECINGGYGGDLSDPFATNWWLRAHQPWITPMAHKPMHDGIGYGFEGVLVLFMAIVDVGLMGIVKLYTS